MHYYRRLLISIGFATLAAPLVIGAARADDWGKKEDDGQHEHSVHIGGWSGETVQGSGKVVSQTRSPGDFDALELRDGTDVDIAVGSPASVTVQGDDNLLDLIRTEVHGHTLVVDSRGSYRSWHGPRVLLRVPALSAVSIHGSGDVRVRDLAGSSADFSIEGSGDLAVQGAADHVRLQIAGSGDADLSGLKAHEVRVEIDGSGDAAVYATASLEAEVNGSGDVHYAGNPTRVQTAVHGSGDIVAAR